MILTIEDNCNTEGQKQIAAILKEVLGDMLYRPDEFRPKEFPSPHELRGKVVIRDKPQVPLPQKGEEGIADQADGDNPTSGQVDEIMRAEEA